MTWNYRTPISVNHDMSLRTLLCRLWYGIYCFYEQIVVWYGAWELWCVDCDMEYKQVVAWNCRTYIDCNMDFRTYVLYCWIHFFKNYFWMFVLFFKYYFSMNHHYQTKPSSQFTKSKLSYIEYCWKHFFCNISKVIFSYFCIIA